VPVVPGGLCARASADGKRVRVDWDEIGVRGPVLVDVYEDYHWRYALSVTPEDPWLPIELERGVWRLQVRADLFSRDTAGIAHVVIAPDERDALEVAARYVLADAQREGLDPLALAILEDEIPPGEDEDAIRALFGPRNFGVVSLHGVVSHLDADSRHERKRGLRWIAAAIILGVGMLVSVVLFRLELVARANAREVLDSFDDTASSSTASPGLERWLWAFVFLVFALIAALALSKGWF
jgi:hypothetical protein